MNEAEKFLKEYLNKGSGIDNVPIARHGEDGEMQGAESQKYTPSFLENLMTFKEDVTPKPAKESNVLSEKRAKAKLHRKNLTKTDYQILKNRQAVVSIGDAVIRCWTNWSLSGRSSRSEFWKWTIASIIICCMVRFICILFRQTEFADVFQLIWGIGAFWPEFALLVRRFHDVGKTAFLAIIITTCAILCEVFLAFQEDETASVLYFISLGCGLIRLIVALRPSEPFENEYGEIPNLL